MDALLSDEDKKTMYRHIFGSRQDNGSYASRRDDDIQAFEQAGMSFDQFLQACNEFATISEEHSNAGERATEFSRWVNSQMLTAEQAETVRSCFYSQMPTAAERYNEFVAAGIDEEAAYSLANALDDLEPEEGRENVSKLQKYRTVINAGLTESEQMTVLSGIMSESDYAKLETGRSFGVTPEAYVTFREYLLRYDADGNGSFNQSEVEAAINAMSGSEIILPTAGGSGSLNLTNDIKAALWQMANKSWKPKNNPYSTSTGQQVYTALNTENGK